MTSVGQISNGCMAHYIPNTIERSDFTVGHTPKDTVCHKERSLSAAGFPIIYIYQYIPACRLRRCFMATSSRTYNLPQNLLYKYYSGTLTLYELAHYLFNPWEQVDDTIQFYRHRAPDGLWSNADTRCRHSRR